MRVVLGQPRGEAPVAVVDTAGCSRVKRCDRRLKGVEQRALPVGEMFERVAVGDDQLKAAADDVVEASLAARALTTPWTLRVPASGSGSPMGWWSRPAVSGASSSGGGGPAARNAASRSAAAWGSSWQRTLPSSIASRITASFCGCRSASTVSSSRSGVRPRSTRSSFQARFAASRSPEHNP